MKQPFFFISPPSIIWIYLSPIPSHQRFVLIKDYEESFHIIPVFAIRFSIRKWIIKRLSIACFPRCVCQLHTIKKASKIEGVEKRSKKKNLNDGKEKYKEKYYERVKRFSLIPYVRAPSPLASALFIIKRFPYRNSKNFSPKVSWSFRL